MRFTDSFYFIKLRIVNKKRLAFFNANRFGEITIQTSARDS